MVVVGDKRLKENIKAAIKVKLIEIGVISEDNQELPWSSTALTFQTHGLYFEQQKEILVLQLEHERMKQELEVKAN